MFSHSHPSYWSLSEWLFLTDRSGSSWRSLEFWPGRPHLSCSACTEERTCVNCGWPQGRSVQTDDLREGLTIHDARWSEFPSNDREEQGPATRSSRTWEKRVQLPSRNQTKPRKLRANEPHCRR